MGKVASNQEVCVCVCVCVCCCISCAVMTLWTVACQAPLSTGFYRQEYRSGLPFPSPGDFPNPGIQPASPVSPALAGKFFTTVPLGLKQLKTTQEQVF